MGLGVVGCELGGALLDAGFRVQAWDRDPEARQAFAGTGADLREAARFDAPWVLLSLPLPEDVEDVLFGEQGIARHLAPGTVVVDLTTGRPALTRRLASRLEEAGLDLLDAGVSFEPAGRELLVGGKAVVYHRLRPVLDALAVRHFHLGGHGHGHLGKLAKNMLNAGYFTAISEAFAFAAKCGADPARLFECIGKSAAASVLLDRLPNQVLTRAFKAKGSIRIHARDLRHALETGRDEGAVTPMTALIGQIFDWTLTHQGPAWAQYRIITFWETLNGVEVRPRAGTA